MADADVLYVGQCLRCGRKARFRHFIPARVWTRLHLFTFHALTRWLREVLSALIGTSESAAPLHRTLSALPAIGWRIRHYWFLTVSQRWGVIVVRGERCTPEPVEGRRVRVRGPRRG